MPRRKLMALVALGLVLFSSLLAGAAGMSTRFLDVGVEVFHSLGLLGMGWYEPLDVRFLSMDIGNVPTDDAASLAQATAACGSASPVPAECAALAKVDYVFTRQYTTEPVLGATYRVVLTNKTDASLGVVLAIDGLNTNGGVAAVGTADDRKWILAPRQTVRISGWQVSTDEALAFRFETPSHSQAENSAERGTIRVDVYLPLAGEGGSRGTGAGSVIGQPTVLVPFESVTKLPLDVVEINYARTSVSLGILCGETGGVGVRITQVVTGTIAELRGLQAGDVITHVNAIAVNTCGELSAVLATKKPGDRVVLKVHRADRDFLLTLEIEE
jgi:hypothetical protein